MFSTRKGTKNSGSKNSSSLPHCVAVKCLYLTKVTVQKNQVCRRDLKRTTLSFIRCRVKIAILKKTQQNSFNGSIFKMLLFRFIWIVQFH